MNKIDQVFDQIHKHVCDKNAQILDPKEKKKTFYLDTMSWRSAKSIEDIRKNILLRAWMLGILDNTIINSTFDSAIQTAVCLSIALCPQIRDVLPNNKQIRELYSSMILTVIFLNGFFAINDPDIQDKVNFVIMTIMSTHFWYWANSSDQPKKWKRWLQDESLKQRLLDLMNPPPITIKTSEV